MNGPEFRAVEFRATEPVGDGRTLTGYAAVFNTPTRIQDWIGSWDETIAPGAFRKTLRAKTPVLQFDHGHDPATGTIPIGTIEDLNEDDTGLFVRARLYDNAKVEPIRQAIEGGAIDGMSFRFSVVREEWRDAEGKKLKAEQVDDFLWAGVEGLQRSIQEVQLYELGPVVFPAYDSTSVGVRSLFAQLSPGERKALIQEVAAELRRLPDLTGRSTRGVDGGEPGSQTEEHGATPPRKNSRRMHQHLRLATAGVPVAPVTKEQHNG